MSCTNLHYSVKPSSELLRTTLLKYLTTNELSNSNSRCWIIAVRLVAKFYEAKIQTPEIYARVVKMAFTASKNLQAIVKHDISSLIKLMLDSSVLCSILLQLVVAHLPSFVEQPSSVFSTLLSMLLTSTKCEWKSLTVDHTAAILQVCILEFVANPYRLGSSYYQIRTLLRLIIAKPTNGIY